MRTQRPARVFQLFFLVVVLLPLAGNLKAAGQDAASAADPADAPVPANVYDPAEVIAYKGDAVLTQKEIDAAFSKLPEQERLAFIRDGAKVDQLIASLLQRKRVAAEAEKAGFDRDPLVADRVRLAAQKELAEAWLDHVVASADEADYAALAHEDYLANPDAYRSEEVLDISHILISSGQRSPEAAQQRADELRLRLAEDPSSFDALVQEFSDDPLKASNGGRYPEMRRGQMVERFEKAAFALEQAGEISQPVETQYGYHIIRLNGRSGNERLPYEAVQAEAMERAQENYRENYRRLYLRKLLQDDPIVIPEGAVEIMARRHFGENLELAPEFRD
jgi:peptidyl-prolyl cis-trans isomerase C